MESTNFNHSDMASNDAVKMLNDLNEAPVALLEVKQKYSPSLQHQTFAIVEGADDELFYSGHIKTLLDLNDNDLTVLRAGNKRNVFKTYNEMDWMFYQRSRILFFADRDYDELTNEHRYPTAENIYTTDRYAIENYLCSSECFAGLCSTACRKSKKSFLSIDRECAQTIYLRAFAKFENTFKDICKYSIAWRRHGLKPNLKNINLKHFFSITQGNVTEICTGALELIEKQCGITHENASIDNKEIEEISLSLEDYGDFVSQVNGKLAFEFFQMTLLSMQDYKFPSGATITCNGLLNANIFSSCVALAGCPKTLRKFLLNLEKI